MLMMIMTADHVVHMFMPLGVITLVHQAFFFLLRISRNIRGKRHANILASHSNHGAALHGIQDSCQSESAFSTVTNHGKPLELPTING